MLEIYKKMENGKPSAQRGRREVSSHGQAELDRLSLTPAEQKFTRYPFPPPILTPYSCPPVFQPGPSPGTALTPAPIPAASGPSRHLPLPAQLAAGGRRGTRVCPPELWGSPTGTNPPSSPVHPKTEPLRFVRRAWKMAVLEAKATPVRLRPGLRAGVGGGDTNPSVPRGRGRARGGPPRPRSHGE